MNPIIYLRIILSAVIATGCFLSGYFALFAILPLLLVGQIWGKYTTYAASIITLILLSVLTQSIQLTIIALIYYILPAIILIHFNFLTKTSDPTHKKSELIYYPTEKLISICILYIASIGTICFLTYWNHAGGLPNIFVQNVFENKEFIQTLQNIYHISITETLIQYWVTSALVTLPSIWFIILFANLQVSKTIAQKLNMNLRPKDNWITFSLPKWIKTAIIITLIMSLVKYNQLNVLFSAITTLLLSSYFLLGLIIINIICKAKAVAPIVTFCIYTSIFILPWATIPVTLIGILDSQLNLRKKFAKHNNSV